MEKENRPHFFNYHPVYPYAHTSNTSQGSNGAFSPQVNQNPYGMPVETWRSSNATTTHANVFSTNSGGDAQSAPFFSPLIHPNPSVFDNHGTQLPPNSTIVAPSGQQQPLSAVVPSQVDAFAPPPPSTPIQSRVLNAIVASANTPSHEKAVVSTPSATVAKPKGPAKPTPAKTTRRGTGKGSRSGQANRRNGGESDEEVAKLTEEQLAKADVPTTSDRWTEDQKLTVVQHITSAEIWPTFKSVKAKVFRDLAQKQFNSTKTTTQVRNLWNRVWAMYKINRRREEHTGGKDGDEPSDDDDSDSASNSDDDDDGADETPCEAGKKRKVQKRAAKRERYSLKQLNAFKESVLYDIIDAVAHNDRTVVREHAVSSADPASKDDEGGSRKKVKVEKSSTRDALVKLAEGALKRQTVTTELTQAQLDIMRRKEAREAEQAKDELLLKMSSQAMEMLNHLNPVVRKIGEKLLEDVATKTGVTL